MPMSSHAQVYHYDQAFTLESSGVLKGVHIAYETYGERAEDDSNVIVVCHALTGSSHVAAHDETDEKGWWDGMVGPGLAIDTTRFFVICMSMLGSCRGTTGPITQNPETGQTYGLSFPVVTIGDAVAVQKLLLDHLDIKLIYAVVGPSMGGMQALEWAIRSPDMVQRCVVMASSASLSPQALAFGSVGRNAIVSDKAFLEGN